MFQLPQHAKDLFVATIRPVCIADSLGIFMNLLVIYYVIRRARSDSECSPGRLTHHHLVRVIITEEQADIMNLHSPFLTLPLEIRYSIYSHLCSTEPISYPWKFSPISSVDSRPPPLALQITCRNLFAEIQSYFYGRATLRFVNPAAQPLFSGQHRDAWRKAIRLTKKIEIMLIWNITLEQAESNHRSWSVNVFLSGIVELLLEQGENLGLVTLCIRDACEKEVDWSFKRKILAPLADLPPAVRFAVGEVTAADEEEDRLKQLLQDHVQELNTRGTDAACIPN